MTSPDHDHWRIQDAKQRFREPIRAVELEGPPVITRPAADPRRLLLAGPKLDDQAVRALLEAEAGRNSDFGRPGLLSTELSRLATTTRVGAPVITIAEVEGARTGNGGRSLGSGRGVGGMLR